jgi:ribose transport system permease protein
MSTTTGTRARLAPLARQPWLVAGAGALVMWVVLSFIGAQGAFGVLSANGFLASFTAIAALGQLLVITSGNGAIDLSIANVITLSVYVVTLLQAGDNARLPLAILVTLLVAGGVGALSGAIVIGLGVPAIVATLAVGFIVQSSVVLLSNIPGRGQASPALAWVARHALFGVPYVALIAVAVAAAVAVLVWRSGLGLRILAAGQNFEAARLAGLKPQLARFIVFPLSGLLAGVTGILLSSYADGAFLGIGDDYLMNAIAAVVLGGTIMLGGKPSVVGAGLGALFLAIVVAVNTTHQKPPGARFILQGAIILGALSLGSTTKPPA